MQTNKQTNKKAQMSPDHLFCYPELQTVNVHHYDNLYDSLREKVCGEEGHRGRDMWKRKSLWWEAKIRMRKGLGSDYSLWGNAIKNPGTLHKPLFWRLPSRPNSTSWRPGLQHGSLWGTFEIQTIVSTECDRNIHLFPLFTNFQKNKSLPYFLLWNSFRLILRQYRTSGVRWECLVCVCVFTHEHMCACPQVSFLLVKLPVFSHKVIFQWPV